MSHHIWNSISWIDFWELNHEFLNELSIRQSKFCFSISSTITSIDRTRFSFIGPIVKVNRMRPKYFMSISITFCCIRELNTIYFNSLRNSKFNTCIFYFRVSSITYPKSEKFLPILIINDRPLW